MSNAKSVFQSKTIWFNVISALIAFASSGSLPAGLAPYVPVIIAVGNLVLRFLTTGPVELPGR